MGVLVCFRMLDRWTGFWKAGLLFICFNVLNVLTSVCICLDGWTVFWMAGLVFVVYCYLCSNVFACVSTVFANARFVCRNVQVMFRNVQVPESPLT